jgi:hypothetical protein
MLSDEWIMNMVSQQCAAMLDGKQKEISPITIARAIEAEVRKQDDALIQQMLEAIEAETSDTWECNSYHPKLYDAAVAARARLGEKT